MRSVRSFSEDKAVWPRLPRAIIFRKSSDVKRFESLKCFSYKIRARRKLDSAARSRLAAYLSGSTATQRLRGVEAV